MGVGFGGGVGKQMWFTMNHICFFWPALRRSVVPPCCVADLLLALKLDLFPLPILPFGPQAACLVDVLISTARKRLFIALCLQKYLHMEFFCLE